MARPACICARWPGPSGSLRSPSTIALPTVAIEGVRAAECLLSHPVAQASAAAESGHVAALLRIAGEGTWGKWKGMLLVARDCTCRWSMRCWLPSATSLLETRLCGRGDGTCGDGGVGGCCWVWPVSPGGAWGGPVRRLVATCGPPHTSSPRPLSAVAAAAGSVVFRLRLLGTGTRARCESGGCR